MQVVGARCGADACHNADMNAPDAPAGGPYANIIPAPTTRIRDGSSLTPYAPTLHTTVQSPSLASLCTPNKEPLDVFGPCRRKWISFDLNDLCGVGVWCVVCGVWCGVCVVCVCGVCVCGVCVVCMHNLQACLQQSFSGTLLEWFTTM